jgi:hypothetical protein
MPKLGTPIPKVEVADTADGDQHKFINEVDFDPKHHVLWSEFSAKKEKKTGKPAVSKNTVREKIEAADNLGALAKIASEFKLKLPGNITNVKTAKTKLLAQLEE